MLPLKKVCCLVRCVTQISNGPLSTIFSGLIARFYHAEFGQYANFHKNPLETHENILEKCMNEFVTDSYEISLKENVSDHPKC